MPTFGPEGLPYPNTSDAPDGPGAFLALLQAMSVGGAKVYASQSALTASGTGFAGQLAVVTSDSTAAFNGVYVSNGSAWTLLTGAPFTGTITYLNSGGVQYSAGTPAPVLKTRGPLTGLTGTLTSAPASFVAGTNYNIATIPTAFAPATKQVFACSANGTAVGAIAVDSTGAIGVVFNTSFTTTSPSPLALSLSPCKWETPGV